MLVPDPIARICSSQIKYHPWLKEEGRKIPRRVSYPKEIAEHIIEEYLKLPHFSKYTKSKAVEFLSKRQENNFTVAYKILQDIDRENKMKKDQMNRLG